MEISLDQLNEGVGEKQKRRKMWVTILLISLGIHVLIGVIAAGVVVAKYLIAPPATFVAQKKVFKITSPEREQKMALAAFEEAAALFAFCHLLQQRVFLAARRIQQIDFLRNLLFINGSDHFSFRRHNKRRAAV